MRHILVAGGGLAGLIAGRELARAGLALTLLEARDRLGGRVWTVRDGFVAGQHGELGAEFIDAGQQDICALCQELSVPLVRVLRSGFTHRYHGAGGRLHVSRTRPWHELADVLAPLVRRYKAAGGNPASAPVREMSTVSLREWLRQADAPADLHAMADTLRGFFLADPGDLSVLPVVEQISNSGSSAQVELYRVEGGTDRLVAAVAHSFNAHLLLRHRIIALVQAPDRVTAVVVDEHGRQQQLDADAAVVALPASTLAEISMTPALPEDQARAIRTLRYGHATKVVLQTTRDPFARGGRGRRARAFATDTDFGAFWDGGEDGRPSSPPQIPRRHFILTFLAGGSASRALRARADRGAEAVLADPCWLGLDGSSVRALRTFTWEDDPFARGGYAFFDPAFDPARRVLLSRPAGRLVFAGEHTSARWQGYMNGAVESGLRAASEVISRV